MKFNLKADNDFTIIDETINFKSSLPIKFILEGIFKRQHNLLFKNIELKQISKIDLTKIENKRL